jgi:hypothetical protein
MITYTLPKRIRYIPASAVFPAVFNNPTIAKYDFNNNTQVFIKGLLAHTIYMIDSISIGGNMAGEDFLSSIDTTPVFNLKKSIDNENIFDKPMQINGYATDRQIVHFFHTGLNNCDLIASITGKLIQLPDYIGLNTFQLAINLSIHAIDENDFHQEYFKQG